ncbi:MAG: integrase arm-type DNA-binding domain-containing protein [Bradyrhizobium sp.]|nr:integrase arm-type DNA-binding domain-containing protein [Bradyrhizobium sp.]
MAKRQLHKLSAREAETIAEPGRHSDGGGLYLAVEAGEHGRRQWIFLYRARGTSKRRELGLGPAKGKAKDGLSLADARLKAGEVRKKLAEGKDPAAERRAEKAAGITFGEFADALLESIKSGFKGKKTYTDWKRDIKVRCKPIRSKPLQEITTTDVLSILSPMWMTINRTARETRSRVERVFMAARAKGLRSGENPATWRGNLKELLPKVRRTKRHHAAAPYKEVPRIVRALQERHRAADTSVNLAAEFLVLTAVRTGEARFMRTREVDFAEKLWTIPAERMKTEDDPEGSPFEVPLSDRAVSILKAVIPKNASPEAYVFAGQWSRNGGKPLGMNAVLHALKAVYPAMTTHGCRSSFRDWTGDETTYERDVAEMALAHKVGDEVEQAYRRGSALKKRRRLMEAWARYVGGASNIVILASREPQLDDLVSSRQAVESC